MEDQNEKNLELLKLLGTSESFLKLSNLDGIETIKIDTNDEVFLFSKRTLWLRWDDEYFFHIPAFGEAERIIEMGKKVKNKSSQLFKAMRPDFQILAKVKIVETDQEGILVLKQKRLRSRVEEAIKNGTIREVDFMVTTQNDKRRGGSVNVTKVITPIRTKEKYTSEIEWPEEEAPEKEMVDFYLSTLENLARGMKLDSEDVRKDWFDILGKYGKEDEFISTDDINEIFGAEKDLKGTAENLTEKVLRLCKEKNHEVKPDIIKIISGQDKKEMERLIELLERM